MKRLLVHSIAAIAALGFVGLACAQTSPSEPSSTQPMPSEQPTPSPSTPAAPSAEQAGQGSADASSRAEPPSTEGHASSGAATRLAAIVPSGMSTQEACAGFVNVTDCATVLHVAQNLNLPFTDLKAKLSGGQDLSGAIHQMKPEADPKAEMSKAIQQARLDIAPPQG